MYESLEHQLILNYVIIKINCNLSEEISLYGIPVIGPLAVTMGTGCGAISSYIIRQGTHYRGGNIATCPRG